MNAAGEDVVDLAAGPVSGKRQAGRHRLEARDGRRPARLHVEVAHHDERFAMLHQNSRQAPQLNDIPAVDV
jgi:hypothetical protein